ncbi:MAG: imidazolonepropionase [Emcibacter sp.]|nr:imidazolonepropionase [Emcibacter sp.]
MINGYDLRANAAIVTKKDKIVWLGQENELPAEYTKAQMISCRGHFMTPGLIDCHTHLIYGGNRIEEFEKRLNGISYTQIAQNGGGILSTVQATRQANEAVLYGSAKKRLAYLQKSGVTTLEIKSGYGLDLKNELKMLRVARLLGQDDTVDVVTSFLGAHAVPPEFADDPTGYMDFVIDEILPAVAKQGLADAVDVFCEPIAFNKQLTEKLFSAARALNLPVKIHAEQLSNSGGAKLAASYQALSADHLEYLDEAAVKHMAAAGTVAVLLPGAFYTLRDDRVPPVDLLRQYGVPMAVASDSNPGSSPALSLSLMINMATTLFRLTPEEALSGVTCYGAQALGLDDRGVLQVGKKADFALWDITHPAELSYQLGGNLCIGVVKDGVPIIF